MSSIAKLKNNILIPFFFYSTITIKPGLYLSTCEISSWAQPIIGRDRSDQGCGVGSQAIFGARESRVAKFFF